MKVWLEPKPLKVWQSQGCPISAKMRKHQIEAPVTKMFIKSTLKKFRIAKTIAPMMSNKNTFVTIALNVYFFIEAICNSFIFLHCSLKLSSNNKADNEIWSLSIWFKRKTSFLGVVCLNNWHTKNLWIVEFMTCRFFLWYQERLF